MTKLYDAGVTLRETPPLLRQMNVRLPSLLFAAIVSVACLGCHSRDSHTVVEQMVADNQAALDRYYDRILTPTEKTRVKRLNAAFGARISTEDTTWLLHMGRKSVDSPLVRHEREGTALQFFCNRTEVASDCRADVCAFARETVLHSIPFGRDHVDGYLESAAGVFVRYKDPAGIALLKDQYPAVKSERVKRVLRRALELSQETAEL